MLSNILFTSLILLHLLLESKILLDLDGTLTNTADVAFKAMKDGIEETDTSKIPIIEGAIDFVNELKKLKYEVFIISDSHPKYVTPIVQKFFNIPSVNLADKPNTTKTLSFLNSQINFTNTECEYFVVGDTWLDIELGRGLGYITILTKLYRAKNIEERDGIGQDRKNLKSGPTFIAKSYKQILEIINDPISNLLCVEGVFYNKQTNNTLHLKDFITNDFFIAHRALGRQNSGECDKYAVADKYFEFNRPDRTKEFLNQISNAVSYLLHSIENTKFTWDYFTYVPDKQTTIPPNKMKELFQIINTRIEKKEILIWSGDIKTSIKNEVNYENRIMFVNNHLHVDSSIDLNGKSIIILDDQYTTGATASAICEKLKSHGSKNLLFLSLFYLINTIESSKVCSKCGKRMLIKIRRSDGHKFYSCPLPKYGGNGCGLIIDINNI